jgi:hypothetical protein
LRRRTCCRRRPAGRAPTRCRVLVGMLERRSAGSLAQSAVGVALVSSCPAGRRRHPASVPGPRPPTDRDQRVTTPAGSSADAADDRVSGTAEHSERAERPCRTPAAAS